MKFIEIIVVKIRIICILIVNWRHLSSVTYFIIKNNKLEEYSWADDSTNGQIKKGYCKKIKAKELWDSIIQCAWNTAEPGILFWDTILDNDPASVYDKYRAVSTNPCGLNLASH